MKTKDELIESLQKQVNKLKSRNVRLSMQIKTFKIMEKTKERDELRQSLNDMTAIYGKLLIRLGRPK